MITVNENNPIILQTELLADQFVTLFKERFVGEIIDESALKVFILQSIDTKKISKSTLETGLRGMFQQFQVDIELDNAAFDTVETFTMAMQAKDIKDNKQAENVAVNNMIALMDDPTAYLAKTTLERLKTTMTLREIVMKDTTNMTLRSLTTYIFNLVMDRFPANKSNHINQHQLYEYIRNLLLQNTANAELEEYRDIFIHLYLNEQGKCIEVHHADTTHEFVYDAPIEISEVDEDQISAYTREFVRVLCLDLDKDTQTIFSKKLYASIIASHQQYIGMH